ncbi:hypothetical protein B296_00050765, partial [Ensete ventricosum]
MSREIQGVNVVVPQRRVFVCASELALDETLAAGSSTSVNNATARRAVDSRGECLGTAEAELLGGHSGVEAGGRKGRGSDDESSGAQLPKSKASVRKEVDSEEHHSAVEADLPIAKEGMQMQGRIVGPWAWQHHGTQRRDFRGVIDPLLGGRALVVKGAEE